jgi:protein-L-isoaspartate(D-aspartate) O-methyltransferase
VEFEVAREEMVREQLEAREVRDPRVLDAMRRVPRHLFVPDIPPELAYADHPQPIGEEQTISQPLMVALMTEALDLWGDEKVLEIGTGSGYQTAILAELCASVVSIERHASLADRARCVLESLGYRNISVYAADGTLGWPDEAPFPRILVTAGAPRVPRSLLDQLDAGGLLVAPIGDRFTQELVAVHKDAGGVLRSVNHGACTFVPLVGREGW